MSQETLLGFLMRHRFPIGEVAEWGLNSLQKSRLLELLPRHHWLVWHLKNKELRSLSVALALGSHMANCDTDDDENFAKFSSVLNDEQWRFALRFCPYHDVAATLDNLVLVQSAMDDAYLGLNTALAGMEVAIVGRLSNTNAYDLEKSKATSNLINFTALYSSYIDACRRIRKMVGMPDEKPYNRAIRRLIAENSAQHSFIKDYRNFQLHYRIVEPHIVVRGGKERKSSLCLSANQLLFSGYAWKEEARIFLGSSEKLDVIRTAAVVLADVKRLVRFHRKFTERRLRHQKEAYEQYCHERDRHDHLQSSMIDIGAIFKQPKSLIARLLNREFVEQVLNSALSEDDMFSMLSGMANRHKNLPKHVQKKLESEVKQLIKKRQTFARAGAYLQGQLQE